MYDAVYSRANGEEAKNLTGFSIHPTQSCIYHCLKLISLVVYPYLFSPSVTASLTISIFVLVHLSLPLSHPLIIFSNSLKRVMVLGHGLYSKPILDIQWQRHSCQAHHGWRSFFAQKRASHEVDHFLIRLCVCGTELNNQPQQYFHTLLARPPECDAQGLRVCVCISV